MKPTDVKVYHELDPDRRPHTWCGRDGSGLVLKPIKGHRRLCAWCKRTRDSRKRAMLEVKKRLEKAADVDAYKGSR